MSRLSSELEGELESEYEDEIEGMYEEEGEEEQFLGALGGIARTVGGLLGGGDGEGELEDEIEGMYEGEDEWESEEEGEEFLGALGGIARTVGGLLGGGGEGEDEWEVEGEGEWEIEGEYEGEDEGEYEGEEEAEEFFKNIGRAFRKAAPFLRVLAKTAGPLVATAVGGPAAGALARAVTSQLEGESEDEVEAEFEDMANAPLSGAQALAEYYADRASESESEAEAEAFAGAAAYVSISPRDRRDLVRLLPSLLRGAAVVTRMLHSNPSTRPAVRMVPGMVNAASGTLARRIAAGEPVGPADVGAVLGTTAQRALSGGPATRSVLWRHSRGLSRARRNYGYRGVRRGYGYRPYRGRPYAGRSGYPRGTRYPVATGVRTPVRSRVQAGPVRGRPRPGMVRVVTPVRLPATSVRPARTVRIVSDVKVPRGAVAGRSTTTSARRR